MAKYTMELREVINYKDIFQNLDFPFYTDDVEIKEHFKKQFVYRYFYDEIGFESVDRFICSLHGLLLLRMDYYKEIYRTILESNNCQFMLNKDLKETFIREYESSGNSESNNEVNGNATTSNDAVQKFLDTPRQQIKIEDNYLSNITKNNIQAKSDSSNTANSVNESNAKGKEKTELISQGNIGITSSAELLTKWRDSIISINELIIEECSQLFMGVY